MSMHCHRGYSRQQNQREMKINAIAAAIEHGASESDINRWAPEHGCDSAVITQGIRRGKRRLRKVASFTGPRGAFETARPV